MDKLTIAVRLVKIKGRLAENRLEIAARMGNAGYVNIIGTLPNSIYVFCNYGRKDTPDIYKVLDEIIYNSKLLSDFYNGVLSTKLLPKEWVFDDPFTIKAIYEDAVIYIQVEEN